MKKTFLASMVAVLLCMILAACSGDNSPISKYCDSLEKGREKMYEGNMTNGEFSRKINEEFMGQQLTTELDVDVPFEIIEPFKVVSLSPLYGGIEFEAIIKTDKPQDFVYIACHNNKPIQILNCNTKWNEDDDTYNIKFFLNVGNIIQGGEKADEKLRSISRVVVTEYGSDLFIEINN
ncbi:hypothetical protein SAMN06298211_10328 [Prevotellaceae bacterium MN60]|nr:hypothetical protein SAMN06298211_10328 [Prevotellaceae bacterium MN60]